MIVDLVVPEQSLVTVTPLEVLGSNVLVGILSAILQRGHVAPVLPVLVPQVVGIGAGGNEAGSNTVDGDLPPELGGALGVVLDVLAFLDEFVLGRGAGEAALSPGANLGGEAGSVANGLSGSKHGGGDC